jgi:4-hydroxybenzoate polyprenyltransferase
MTSWREPLSYAFSEQVEAALVMASVFLRIDSPVSVTRWWLCASRSCFASAIVASPIHSRQCSIGSWLVLTVARVLAQSSMISSKPARVDESIAVMSQSSGSNTSVFLSVYTQGACVPLAWRMRVAADRKLSPWWDTRIFKVDFLAVPMPIHSPPADVATRPPSLTPLVVDLDGTLTPTDTLVESVIQFIKRSPLNLFRIFFWLVLGRAGFKGKIAARVSIAADLLPYRPTVLDYLHSEKGKGRTIILATAAHRSIADKVAAHLGIFDSVLASDAHHNLKGRNKLAAIQQNLGDNFVYAGDCQADVPIWQAARAAVLVGVSPSLTQAVGRVVPIERVFAAEKAGLATWLKALRVHQWLKNLLLFVPLLTAFSFSDPGRLITLVVAFMAFSLAASATYVVNDLWDLDNDRAHPRKRLRPFASAKIPISHGVLVAGLALVFAFGLAWAVNPGFFGMLALYVVLTSFYSWVLKEYVLLDVLMLALLYTLRILAGSVAVGITTSSWLLAFSVFIFLSLALVKRCSELVSLQHAGDTATRGRDYRVSDLVVLWPLGVGAALSAVVVFGLFINAAETQARYVTPQLLWLVAIGLIYWLGRIWIKTSRGEMPDDPVIYAIKDWGSRITVLAMVGAMLAAHFFSI